MIKSTFLTGAALTLSTLAGCAASTYGNGVISAERCIEQETTVRFANGDVVYIGIDDLSANTRYIDADGIRDALTATREDNSIVFETKGNEDDTILFSNDIAVSLGRFAVTPIDKPTVGYFIEEDESRMNFSIINDADIIEVTFGFPCNE